VRLIEGYLWCPKELPFDPAEYVRVDGLGGDGRLLLAIEPAQPPVAYFEDGTPTASQRFWMLSLAVFGPHPGAQTTLELQGRLDGLLESAPPGVGWMLFGDDPGSPSRPDLVRVREGH